MDFARFGRTLSVLAAVALTAGTFWHLSGDSESFAGKAFGDEAQTYQKYRSDAAYERVKSRYADPSAGRELDKQADKISDSRATRTADGKLGMFIGGTLLLVGVAVMLSTGRTPEGQR